MNSQNATHLNDEERYFRGSTGDCGVCATKQNNCERNLGPQPSISTAKRFINCKLDSRESRAKLLYLHAEIRSSSKHIDIPYRGHSADDFASQIRRPAIIDPNWVIYGYDDLFGVYKDLETFITEEQGRPDIRDYVSQPFVDNLFKWANKYNVLIVKQEEIKRSHFFNQLYGNCLSYLLMEKPVRVPIVDHFIHNNRFFKQVCRNTEYDWRALRKRMLNKYCLKPQDGEGTVAAVVSWMRDQFDGLKDFVTGSYETIKVKMIEFLTKTTKSTIESLCACVPEYIKTYLTKMSDMLTETMRKLMEVCNNISESIAELKPRVKFICAALIALLLASIGIIGWKMFCAVTGYEGPKPGEQKDKLRAQGPEATALCTAMSLALSIIGVKYAPPGYTQHCTKFSTLFHCSLLTGTGLVAVFCLLPEYLKNAIYYKFASDEKVLNMKVDEWRYQAIKIWVKSKVGHLVKSKGYYDLVVEKNREINELLQQYPGKKLQPQNMKMYYQMLTLECSLMNANMAYDYRDQPFAVHVYSAPGLGKTAVVQEIVDVVLENENVMQRMFARPVSTPFWDGYNQQPVVFMDEFLEGSPEQVSLVAVEYLSIVSANPFLANYAGIDSPAVGIKGDQIAPKFVITANNGRDFNVPGYNFVAMNRRRNLVIQLLQGDAKYWKSTNGFLEPDIRTYPNEIRELKHLKFVVSTGMAGGSQGISHQLSWETVVKIIRRNLERHNEKKVFYRNMSKKRGEKQQDDHQVQEMLDELREEMNPIDPGVFTIGGALRKLYSTIARTFFPQGRKEKFAKNKICIKCGEAFMTKGRRTVCVRCREQARPDIIQKCNICCETFTSKRSLRHCPECSEAVRGVSETIAPTSSAYLPDPPSENRDSSDVTSVVSNESGQTSIQDQEYHSVEESENPLPGYIPYDSRGRIDIRNGYMRVDDWEAEVTDGKLLRIRNFNPENDETYSEWIQEDPSWPGKVLFHRMLENEVNKYWVKNFANEHLALNIDEAISFAGVMVGFFTTAWIALVLGVWAVRSMWKGQSSGTVQIRAQGAHYGGHETTNRPKTANEWVKGKAVIAQDMEICSHGMQIGGYEFSGVPVFGRTVLTYRHAFYDVDGEPRPAGVSMKIRIAGTVYEEDYDPERLYETSCDIAAYEFKVAFPQFKKRVSNFISRDCYQPHGEFLCCLRGEIPVVFQGTVDYNLSYRKGIQSFEHSIALSYPVVTKDGDCGRIVQCLDRDQNFSKIVGLHVAGTGQVSEPKGVCSIITRELVTGLYDLIERKDSTGVERSCDVGPQGYPENELRFSNKPNFKSMSRVPKEQVIYVPTVSKLQRSFLSGKLSEKHKKNLPIMSAIDPRANGRDPVVMSLEHGLSIDKDFVEPQNIDLVFDTMFNNYSRQLRWPITPRSLSFEEACGGIPGILSSINTNTSPGFPLSLNKRYRGKKDFIRFDEKGNLVYDSCYKTFVLDQYHKSLKSPIMTEDESIWLAYLKDEVVTDSKVEDMRMRLIFCGDLTFNIIYRMHYGFLLAAFNNSGADIPIAVGMNQYSRDMEKIHNYLTTLSTEDNFIAGDYKQFDQRFHPAFQKRAYELLFRLVDSKVNLPSVVHNEFLKHETSGAVQVHNMRIKFHSYHMSGCFFTTIVNSLVNEAYIRWAYGNLCPYYVFDSVCRLKVLGDDHVLSVVGNRFSAVDLAQELEKIGQVYTSDRKDQPLSEENRKFLEITFLGAHPRILETGGISGAMKKESIVEALSWTRSAKESDHYKTIINVLENASQWDQKYFEQLKAEIASVMTKKKLMSLSENGWSWKETQNVVGNRLTSTPTSFNVFVANNVQEKQKGIYPSLEEESLHFQEQVCYTQINPGLCVNTKFSLYPQGDDKLTNLENVQVVPTAEKFVQHTHLAVQTSKASLELGTESWVLRDVLTWSKSQAVGTVVATYKLPWELLNKSATANIQNMPFSNFIYCFCDTEVSFQVNGNPFSQGGLMVTSSVFGTNHNYPWSRSHLVLEPYLTEAKSLLIPFEYVRPVYNTFAGAVGHENMGTLQITVQSQLRSINTESVTINVFSRFPRAKFSIPRPAAGSLAPQGNNFSSTNNYTVGDVAGDMPIETVTNPHMSADVNTSIPVDVVMDKPPICSGTIPTFQTIPSCSKSVGVEPVMQMQLHPKEMNRNHFPSSSAEHSIERLCEKKGQIGSFFINNATTYGSELRTFLFDSVITQIHATTPKYRPSNIFACSILNQFLFWRADLNLEFRAFKTKFHQFRLLLTVAYGAPTIALNERNIYFNQVLDFTNDSDSVSVTIPFNASTQYLRTFEGYAQPNIVQDYSCGRCLLTMQSPLIAPSAVDSNVEIIMLASFSNVKVNESNPIPAISILNTFPRLISGPGNNISVDTFGHAIAPLVNQDDEIPKDDGTEKDKVEIVNTDVITSEGTAYKNNLPMDRLDLNSKFEFTVSSIYDILRRYQELPEKSMRNVTLTGATESWTPIGTKTMTRILVTPFDTDFIRHFVFWAGHINYRIICTETVAKGMRVRYVNGSSVRPGSFSVDNPGTYQTRTQTVSVKPNVPIASGVVNSSAYSTSLPLEWSHDQGSGMACLSLSIPFQSHYDWLPVHRRDTMCYGLSDYHGYLEIQSDKNAFHVLTCVGDDFRLSGFNPYPLEVCSLRAKTGETVIPSAADVYGRTPIFSVV